MPDYDRDNAPGIRDGITWRGMKHRPIEWKRNPPHTHPAWSPYNGSDPRAKRS